MDSKKIDFHQNKEWDEFLNKWVFVIFKDNTAGSGILEYHDDLYNKGRYCLNKNNEKLFFRKSHVRRIETMNFDF